MESTEGRGNCYPDPIQPDRTRIGWIGAGVMGAAMASRLLLAGYTLAVHTRTQSKALNLHRAGAFIAESPAAVARASDVIFLTVGHPSDVRYVAFAALSALPAGAVIVDCTSSTPELAREISVAARARGCWAVDAPVSGGDAGARDGRLSILAGGDEGVIQWLNPLFNLLGKANFMGGPGCGQSAKIANQIVVGANLLGLSESAVFATAAGLDKKVFFDGLRDGAAATAVMRLYGNKVAERDFAPGAYAEYMVKDLGMAMVGDVEGDSREEEKAVAVVMPGTALCRQLFQAMVANGDGKMGIHGLVTVVERINGLD